MRPLLSEANLFLARQRFLVVFFIALAITAGAWAQSHPERSRQPRTDHAKTDENFASAMDKLRSTWVKEFNAGHAAKVAALYVDEAVLMRWDGSMHGRASIQALFQKSVTNGAHDYVVHSLHTERSGDLGYDSGAYNVTLRTRVVEGNYLIVVKNIQGRWWIVAHAAVPNPRVR
jgi:ketosteroid isomerase-like protein